MRKLIFAVLLVTLSAGFVKAQDSDDGHLGFRFGLQLSPEIAWLKAQDKFTNSSSPKFGFSYGLMFDYNFTRRYSFSTGLFISQMPSEISYNLDSMKFNSFKDITYYQQTKVKYDKLQYIEIPVSLKLKTNEIGYITYFGQFGFQGGVNIKARGDISDKLGNNNKLDENLGPDIGLTNLALLLGFGLEYSVSDNTSIYGALNFVNGFIDITDNPKGYKSKSNLNQFALRAGVLF